MTALKQIPHPVRTLTVVCAATILFDASLAQIGKRFWFWDLQDSGRYGVRSVEYHHDLRKRIDTVATWGSRAYSIRTNSLGFRDHVVRDVALKSARYRVLLLGDSFTEGMGVQYKDTFAGILSDELQKDRIDVLNAAVASYSPAIYYRKTKFLIEEAGLRLDQAIVLIDISDIDDEARVYDFDLHDNVIGLHDKPETIDPNVGLRSRVQSVVMDNSVILKFLDVVPHALFDPDPDYGACRTWSKQALAAMTDLERSLWTINETVFAKYGRKGLEKGRQNMERLRRLLESNGIPLTIVVYPWPDQIFYRDADSKQVTFWQQWAGENHVAFVNMFPYFVNREDPEAVIGKYFIPCDMHLNEQGHRLFASAFLRECPIKSSPISLDACQFPVQKR